MNRLTMMLLITLAVLNVGAIGFWLVTCRLRVVLAGPADLWDQLQRRIVEASGRLLRGLHGIRPLWSSLWTVRARVLATSPPTSAPEALEGWIAEVERAERAEVTEWIEDPEPFSPERAQRDESAEGTESWWRAWAESGGALPQAADSCRTADAVTPHGGPIA